MGTTYFHFRVYRAWRHQFQKVNTRFAGYAKLRGRHCSRDTSTENMYVRQMTLWKRVNIDLSTAVIFLFLFPRARVSRALGHRHRGVASIMPVVKAALLAKLRARGLGLTMLGATQSVLLDAILLWSVAQNSPRMEKHDILVTSFMRNPDMANRARRFLSARAMMS